MAALVVLALVLFGAGAVAAARERGYALALIGAGLALYTAADLFSGAALNA